MIHQFWRLQEGGEHNLGLAITGDGLVLGRTPFIEQRDARFVVREQGEIERLLSTAYQGHLSADRLMSGLATVAAALNADDHCLARIAAVHWKIPDLPNSDARNGMEVEDVLIKLAGRQRPAAERGDQICKASPGRSRAPWLAKGERKAGAAENFVQKPTPELTQQVKSRIARRALRISLLTVLRVGLEGIANLIPGVDVAADVMMVVDIARTIAEFRKLAIDAATAFDFAQKGPQSLEDLQVLSSGYEEFSTYREFVKGELMLDMMAKRFAAAGDGNQYHHIVTQGGANEGKIPAEQLQNTDNVIRLPTLLHEAVNAEYSKFLDDKKMTMYEWLQTQPYEVQREEGLRFYEICISWNSATGAPWLEVRHGHR